MYHLSSSQELKGISLWVSIAVILMLTISYILLFFIWHFYYKKCVNKGLEDIALKKEIAHSFKKYLNYQEESEQLCLISNELDFEDMQNISSEKKILSRTINGILASIVYCALLLVFIIGLYSRMTTGLTNYFGKSYLVVETGSMETIHPENTYLNTNHLNNQIKQYSLVEFEKVKQNEMKVYDIYAFYDDKNNIIIHRLINIFKDDNNNLTYRFRGDANASSADYETMVPFNKIVGHYTGYQNFGLGVCILYVQSNMGMITIGFALIAVFCFDLFENNASKVISKRKEILLKEVMPEKAYNRLMKRKILKRKLEIEEITYRNTYRKKIRRKVNYLNH